MKFNLDAAQTAFFARQLEHIKAENLEVQYPLLKGRMLVPMSKEQVPAYAETFTTYVYDRVGFAKVISDYSTDLPSVDLLGKSFTNKVITFGASYSYSILEIQKAQALGMNLNSMKANAAAKAIAELENKSIFFGEPDSGLTG
ncbi:MAG: major capsid family protein, partial [Alphaproteobacteria bacterium]